MRWETSDTNIAKFDVEVFDRAIGGVPVRRALPLLSHLLCCAACTADHVVAAVHTPLHRTGG